MLRILRHRVYSHLFGSLVCSLLGSGLATVALGLVAYDIAGADASAVLGAIFTVKMIAYVFVAPLANAAVAHLPRRAVMIGSDVLRLAAALFLPFVGATWQIFVLVFVLQAASATFTPTFQSVVPAVLPDEDDYTNALSLARLAGDLETILSPMLAAVLLLAVPANALFFGTALGFAASALLVLSAALPAGLGLARDDDEEPFFTRARAGVELFFRTPALRPVVALNVTVAAVVSFVLVQTVVVVRSGFGMSQTMVALFLAVNGAGSIATALALPRVLHRAGERSVMLPGAALLCAALVAVGAVLAWARASWAPGAVAVLWLLIGAGWAGVEMPVGRLIPRAVAPERLSAAFAGQFSLSHGCWLVCYPLTGALAAWGLDRTALVMAAVGAVAAVAAGVLWSRGQDDEAER
ncbi:MFS transporter [uncultured Propionibacterium sp.]|uniref:MFS transporter n=1 Tax=uncultured Propionibacterium sp. TaxID=218066 RepID=UPI00292D8473|nr:MFS transporter [uncultured Propionibacterium sp.]